jgi:hypothetical protein
LTGTLDNLRREWESQSALFETFKDRGALLVFASGCSARSSAGNAGSNALGFIAREH